MEPEKKNAGFLKKLHHKYRLVVLNDDTMEEKLRFRLTRFNVFIFAGTATILLIVGTIYLIAFTPLREYIPGYADFNTREVLRDLSLRTDSLERDLRQKDLYILNIRNIIEGKDLVDEIPENLGGLAEFSAEDFPRSREDSLLRAEMELSASSESNLWMSPEVQFVQRPVFFTFFPPLDGIVTNYFNPGQGHFGVDIVSDKNEAIKATLDGTVLFAAWTMETGYTIAIQHNHNLVSVYKHNSVLLKDQGSFVEAGEAIAIIGDTGMYSTGTHLHFELWFNGSPVNPLDYIVFQ